MTSDLPLEQTVNVRKQMLLSIVQCWKCYNTMVTKNSLGTVTPSVLQRIFTTPPELFGFRGYCGE